MTQPIKTFVSESSLDFALRHILDYYDTDFFPRAEEFYAIKHSWHEVKALLLDSDLDGVFSAAPTLLPWPKPTQGFRVVHRLEPLDALLYTAMAREVASQIEQKRSSPEIACSYRIVEERSGFFTEGSGFNVYRERCEYLSQSFPFVLAADIADFYNKIYLHRLRGSIEKAVSDDEKIASRIEYLLTSLNTGASQGIPVGPAASIIMAEATLIDADEFIFERGFEHVRYVDDFRIFGKSYADLQVFLQEFCLYLHDHHRLSLSPQKTSIKKSDDFLREELNNQYQVEKLNILNEIEVVNPYTMEVDGIREEPIENAGEVLVDALKRITRFDRLDLGVIRAIVRRARAHRIKDIASLILENLEFFAPAINDIALYLDAVTDEEFLDKYSSELLKIPAHDASHLRGVRIWMEWYFARHKDLLQNREIRAFVFSSRELRCQAQAALTLESTSWTKDRKSQLMRYASWDRRSIILGGQVLSRDEREKWLKTVVKNESLAGLDRYMAKWVLDGTPKDESLEDEYEHPFDDDFENELPF